jgi:hypothetical protein
VQKALVLADAVLDVDDVIADFEGAQIFQKRLGAAFRAPFRAMGATPEDLLFGDENQAFGGRDDAARERPHHDADFGAPPPRFERYGVEWAGEKRARDVAVPHERGQPLGLRFAARAEKHRKTGLAPGVEAFDEGVERAVFAPRSARLLDRAFEVRLIARGE